MKKIIRICLGMILFPGLLAAQVAKDRVVAIEVSSSNNPVYIQLDWTAATTPTQYIIYRKAPGDWTWNLMATLPGAGNSFKDSTVQEGEWYDYRVDHITGGVALYGFVSTGINVPPVHYRGEVYVAVDSALNANLGPELHDYYRMLVGDGWSVHVHVLGQNLSVPQLQQSIKDWHSQNPYRHNTLLLFGNIPVPYSGNINPDMHPEHKGAWPADVYYGTYGDWTDLYTFEEASRVENKNYGGDGKWDPSYLPAENKLQIGRVYLDKMSQYTVGRDSLYRRYLHKATAYRNNEWNVPRRALIDDRLHALGGEYPGRNGYQNGFALFGTGATFTNTGTYIDQLRDSVWLFSHASSTGGYTSNQQLNSSMFLSPTYSVFQTSFGSYHGDWDINNNLLRAEIAGPGYGLTSVWAGRPHWHFLHMSMGFPIGYSARITQNNFIDEPHRTYDPGALPFGGMVHVALMGDPTLRLHVFNPPANLQAMANANGDEVSLSWDNNQDPATTGYYVYRSDSLFGIWNLITPLAVTGTTYTDLHPLAGSNVYMVRATRLEQSATGTYHNLSQGIFAEAEAPNGDGSITSVAVLKKEFRIYPNPTHGIFRIDFGQGESAVVQVYDLSGKLMENRVLESGGVLDIGHLPAGTYIIRAGELSSRVVLLD